MVARVYTKANQASALACLPFSLPFAAAAAAVGGGSNVAGGYCLFIVDLTERVEWVVVLVMYVHVPWLERSTWMGTRAVSP